MYFNFSYSYLFLGGKHNGLHAKSRYQTGKVLHKSEHQSHNADSGGKKTTFPSISTLIGRAFQQKMDGPNPSEMDIKVFIPAPTYCLQFEKVTSINGKDYKFPLVRKLKKYKLHDFEYENNNFVRESNVKNMIIHHPRARFIFFYISSSVFTR